MADDQIPALIMPSGQKIQPDSREDYDAFVKLGFQPPTPAEQRREQIARDYSQWYYAPVAAGVAAARSALPGALAAGLGAVEVVGGTERARSAAEFVKGLEESHSTADTLGSIAGVVGGATASGGASLALLGAAGGADEAALQHLLSPEGGEKAALLIGVGAATGGTLGRLARGLTERLATRVVAGELGAYADKLWTRGADVLTSSEPSAAYQTLGKLADRVVGPVAAVHAAFNPASIPKSAAVYGAAKAAQKLGTAYGRAEVRVELGDALKKFDELIVEKVLVPGLGGKIAEVSRTAGRGATELGDYVQFQALLEKYQTAPGQTIQATVTHMESVGVPPQVIDAAARGQQNALDYLASALPKNLTAGKAVAPTTFQPSLSQRRRFLERVDTVNDPLGALQDPTPSKMETMSAVYPQLTGRVQAIVAAYAASDPEMGATARRWAAAITGRPATPLGDPDFRAALARQPAPGARPTAPAAPASRAENAVVNSSQTRANRMSE